MSSQNTTSSSIVNDTLARLQPGVELPFELPAEAAMGPTASAKANEKIVSVHPAPTTTILESPPVSAQPHDESVHDDADVQEYMNRLLKRSNTSQTPVAAKPKVTEPAPQPVAPKVEMAAKVWDAKEFVPKSVAPEKKANLTALREVANQSQRSAIETSTRRLLKVESSKYLALSVATFAFGGLFMLMSTKMFDASMLFGITSFLFSVPLTWQALRASRSKAKKQKLSK